jgi:hypothetical protein
MDVDGNDARPPYPGGETALRCYAPSMSAIAAFLFVGYLALRHVAGHALAALSLLTTIVIALGMAGVAVGAIVVSAATIRKRRAAAGACHTCSHPCRQEAELDAPWWPHRPLTRSTLPLTVTPQRRTAPGDRAATLPPATREVAPGGPGRSRLRAALSVLNSVGPRRGHACSREYRKSPMRSMVLGAAPWRRLMMSAISPVHPVWCEAPSPAALSPW